MNYLSMLLVTFVVLLTVIGAMAIGVMFGRRAISGSCGGIAGNGKCEWCAGDGVCKKRSRQTQRGD
jgi:hypothetical protein